MVLSCLRINLLRGCYLLLFIGLGLQTIPDLFGPAQDSAVMDSVVTAVLGAIWLLSFWGLWRPVEMMPLLISEVTWKSIWVLAVAVPRWLDGRLTSEFIDVAFACDFVLPIAIIIPWRKFAAQRRGGAWQTS